MTGSPVHSFSDHFRSRTNAVRKFRQSRWLSKFIHTSPFADSLLNGHNGLKPCQIVNNARCYSVINRLLWNESLPVENQTRPRYYHCLSATTYSVNMTPRYSPSIKEMTHHCMQPGDAGSVSLCFSHILNQSLRLVQHTSVIRLVSLA